MYDKNNIFYKIINKEVQCDFLYETNYTIAINDKFPAAKIHILIIPKNNYTDIDDFSNNASKEEKEDIFNVLSYITKKFNINKTGYKFLSNCKEHGRQEINHLHFHVLGGQII